MLTPFGFQPFSLRNRRRSSGPAFQFTAPTTRFLGYIGDSRLAPGGDDAGASTGTGSGVAGSANVSGGGYAAMQPWAHQATSYRCVMARASNTAIGGQNTNDVIGRLTAINALSCETFLMELGRNDRSAGLTLAQTQTNLATIWASLQAAGHKIILTNGLPETGLTGTPLTDRLDLAAWLLNPQRRIDYPAIIAQIDTLSIMKDPLTAFSFRAGESGDGIHLIGGGGRRYGEGVGAFLNQMYASFSAINLPTTAGDAYNNPSNLTGVLTTNFLLTGTAGTKGGTNPATGNVPDNWDITNSEAGITIVSSIAVGSDGLNEWTITVSGTPTSAGYRTFLIRRLDATNAGNISPGDQLHAVCRASLADNPVNLLGLGMSASLNSTQNPGLLGTSWGSSSTNPALSAGWPMRPMRSQEVITPGSWPTDTSRQIRFQMQPGMQGQSATSWALTIKQAGTRRTV